VSLATAKPPVRPSTTDRSTLRSDDWLLRRGWPIEALDFHFFESRRQSAAIKSEIDALIRCTNRCGKKKSL
jgi:hypothetical protein